MIKYSKRPNDFNAPLCAMQAVLPVFCKEGWQEIARQYAIGLQVIWSNIKYGDADAAKSVRKSLLHDIKLFIKGGIIKSPVMQFLSHATDDYYTNLQLMFSFADSPKFLIYSEKDLHIIADNISDHVADINAITYIDSEGRQICPYSIDQYHSDRDLAGTIYAQRNNIEQFLVDNIDKESESASEEEAFYRENVQHILHRCPDIIDEIARDICCYASGTYMPSSLEQGFFDAILYIQEHIAIAEEQMYDYLTGNASSDLFTLSESKSPITDSDAAMFILHKLGYPKPSCPAVLSNLFYNTNLQQYHIQKQLGQIDISQPIAFHPAPGLGPMFKVRWVFSVETGINNFLNPLAMCIQKADKRCDPNEAYNDQLTYLISNCHMISDAYCLDSTGYSDYLFRAIYYEIMTKLYHMDPTLIDIVMKCLQIPIQIGNDLIPVEFGGMQGEKLLVFIMNHANRLMGLIADRLSTTSRVTIRPNAGDDVVKAAIDGSQFTLADVLTEMTVFAAFNSPTNLSKAAWLQRDGYFDFCSKYFSFVNGHIHCVSGVPAKKYGKETVCIADWAETFKVLDSANQRHSSCSEAFSCILPSIYHLLEEGCQLPNIYNQSMDVKTKIQNALTVPYSAGGLADPDMDLDTDALLNLIRYKLSLILQQYTFNPRGVYLVANMISELVGTELLKAIGSINRTNISDIVKLIRLCSSTAIDEADIRFMNETIAQFERNIITAMSSSRSSSTYHRLERNKDVDILFNLKELQYDSSIPLPDSAPESIFMLSLLTNQEYLDIDNIRNYLIVSKINKKYGGLIVSYEGGAGWSTFYGIKDPDNGKIIRLYNNDDTRYPQFEPIWSCKNDEVRFVVQTLRNAQVSRFIGLLFSMADNSVEAIAEQYAKDIIKDTCIEISKDQLKSLLIDIADQQAPVS